MSKPRLPVPLGGIDQRLFPKPGGAANIVNMCHDHGTWIPAPGAEVVVVVDLGGGFTHEKVVSLGWFAQHNGQQWLLAEFGEPGTPGILGWVRWTDGTVIPIKSDRRIVDVPSSRTRYIQNGNWVYVWSAYNPPFRWNGRRAVPVGFDRAPSAPEVDHMHGLLVDYAYATTPPGGAGASDPAQRGVGTRDLIGAIPSEFLYGYRYVQVSDLGMRSPPSPITWVQYHQSFIPVGETHVRRVTLMVQCAAAPAHVREVEVYRTTNQYGLDTEGTEPPTYLVAKLSPYAARLWLDDHPDHELGVLLNPAASGPVPLRARAVALFAGRMWVATATNDRLFYSAPQFVEQFPDQNWLPCGGQDSGPIVALHAMRDALVVFKERGIFLVTESNGAFGIKTLTSEVGASCPDVVEVPDAGLLFLSEQGPYLLSGGPDYGGITRWEFAGEGLGQTWNRVNKSALYMGCGSLHRREKEVWFMVPSGGGTTADLGIVYHYPSGLWSTREGYILEADKVNQPVICMLETRDPRAELFFGTELAIVHVGRGYAQTREVSYTLGPLDLGDRATVTAAVFSIITEGKHTFEVSHYLDRQPVPVVATPYQYLLLDPERGKPTYEGPQLWGQGLWGPNRNWHDTVPAKISVPLHRQHALEHTVKVSGARLALAGIELQVDPELAAVKQPPRKGLTP